MGAENSVLEGCQWGEDVLSAGLDWDLQHAVTKDGLPITVFQPRKSERKYTKMMEQLAKSLKMLRHPSILRYIGAGKTSEGHFLVTEQATPLVSLIDKLSSLEVCSGLNDVLDALIFLHDKAGVAHNDVGLGSIFVARDGNWKLGELQHACPFAMATSDFLDACRVYRNQDALAPEEKQGHLEVKAGQGHARDIYALGVLMEQLSEHLTDLAEYSKTFEQRLAVCLSGDAAQRPPAVELKKDQLFQNDFIQIVHFLRNVALKTREEKAEFFRGLLPRLRSLPEELVARRLGVLLLSRFVLLESAAVEQVVPHLLTPRTEGSQSAPLPVGVTPLIGADLFRTHLIPELGRVLQVHDAHIRLTLLQHFAAYASLFDTSSLHTDVFPQILLGLRDTSDSLVACSLRALADLVPLLGGDVVIGGQRKTYFFHGMPKFTSTKEKGDQPGNLLDVLKSSKAENSNKGKPLLIDLAGGRYQPTPGPGQEAESAEVRQQREGERQRKAVERERRRQEAQQRKEERQRRLKAQREAAAQEGEGDGPASPPDEEDGDEERGVTGPGREVKDKEVEDGEDSPATGVQVLEMEEEKFASGESSDEWEDWDDGKTDSALKAQDQVIEDEIEAELSRMSVGHRPISSGVTKVPTSPDPYGPPSFIEDWSDSHLDRVAAVVSPKSDESGVNSADVGRPSPKHSVGAAGSHDTVPHSGKGLKLIAKNKTSASGSAKAAQNKKPALVTEDLGLGYDIKSIELTAVQEVDFFADMAPDIKPVIAGTLTTVDVTAEPQTTGTTSSALFAVNDTTADQDGGGWGEEEDWGMDDF